MAFQIYSDIKRKASKCILYQYLAEAISINIMKTVRDRKEKVSVYWCGSDAPLGL